MNLSNIRKTIYYCKRNGIAATIAAVRERLAEKRKAPYVFVPASKEELSAQRARKWENPMIFDIVVPLYRTPKEYLTRMIASVQEQTYPYWRLILADATEGEGLREEVVTIVSENVSCSTGEATATPAKSRGAAGDISGSVEGGISKAVGADSLKWNCGPSRISYAHLASNDGISANTNAALQYAEGDYICLLDHDDVLTPDALYEMASAIEDARAMGKQPRMLYSDEDKCNGDETLFYEPHYKEDFNYDLLLSNNYICHFLVMDASLIKELKLRPEFDGAQDFDLVLRATFDLTRVVPRASWQDEILHVAKVLYHWRCHSSSTAQNPQSKRYAYDAGRRAVQAAIERNGWIAAAEETEHVGFYRVDYPGGIAGILKQRPEIGAIGGPIFRHGKVDSGRINEDGSKPYEDLAKSYSGYMHRAAMQQDAPALDLRNIIIRRECWILFEEVVGVPYVTEQAGTDGNQIGCFDASTLPTDADIDALSIALGRALRERGYLLLYLPSERRNL